MSTAESENFETAPNKAFTIARTLDAPRDLVWKCRTDINHMKQWWAPMGTKIVADSTLELKPGGLFHYGMEMPDGNVVWGKMVHRTIKEPELLECVLSFSDKTCGSTRHPMAPKWPMEVLSRMTFTEEGGKTVVRLTARAINATEGERDLFDASHDSMTTGFSGTLGQLTAYVAKIQGK
jgi:uncharacterized protein YndB with AHSA1/START domain